MFRRARELGRPALMPFLTAGDPDLPTTVQLARALLARGRAVNVPMMLEIGFPYSDPIADGATIQASYTRALDRGIRLAGIFEAIADLRTAVDEPIVAMASFSLVFRKGPEVFLNKAAAAGFDGAIIPDLPVEEADDLRELGRRRNFKIIQLIAPTTTTERAKRIASQCDGFIYYVSVTGITGERKELPTDLPERVAALKQITETPVCIGFGVAKPSHVALLRPVADGVIVGSAIVRQCAELRPRDDAGIARIADFVATLLEPLQA